MTKQHRSRKPRGPAPLCCNCAKLATCGGLSGRWCVTHVPANRQDRLREHTTTSFREENNNET